MKDMDKTERLPLNGTFELTARCNLKCKMCLVRIDRKRMSELGGHERTAEQWIDMARQVMEQGTLELLLTGGEPMLRPDFIEIYKAVAQMGFIVTLYTNATLITTEIMDVFREYPPHNIGITVYGASPETYEKVTGAAEAYHRMLEGVKQLLTLPSNIEIRTTIIKDNLDDLDKITDWALSLGNKISFRVSSIIIKPVRGGIADAESCRLTPEQNVAMLSGLASEYLVKPFHILMEENPDFTFLDNTLKDILDKEDKISEVKEQNLYGCSAGMTSYTITWDGKLIGCQMLGDCFTSPFEEGFKAAWNHFPDAVKPIPIPSQCKDCEINCNSCPATRLAETGSFGVLPEYICREGKLANELDRRLSAEIQQAINKKGRKQYAAL